MQINLPDPTWETITKWMGGFFIGIASSLKVISKAADSRYIKRVEGPFALDIKVEALKTTLAVNDQNAKSLLAGLGDIVQRNGYAVSDIVLKVKSQGDQLNRIETSVAFIEGRFKERDSTHKNDG